MALERRAYGPEEIPASITLEQATNNLLVAILTQTATEWLTASMRIQTNACSYGCINTIFDEEVLHRAESWIEKRIEELRVELHDSGLKNRP